MLEPLKGDTQTLVPEVWRPTVSALVDSLRRRDRALGSGLRSVDAVSEALTAQCLENIADYGDGELVPLPPQAWDTSCAMWTGRERECLVDLWTASGRTDLVLDLRIRADSDGYRYAVHLVYVP